MAKWICPFWGCDVWAYAPNVRPVHPKTANPNFQGKDPHCPVHQVDLTYTQDVPSGPVLPKTSGAQHQHKIGTIDDKLGILVGVTGHQVPIYCDYHQRKHVYKGIWPGSTPTDKPVFLAELYNQNELTLCSKIATSVPWEKFQNASGGVDIIFNCGKTVVGTEGECDILVQGGFQKEKGEAVITFHAYPIERSGSQARTFKSCEAKGNYLDIDI